MIKRVPIEQADDPNVDSSAKELKETSKQRKLREEREFLSSLPQDRFGVNPSGHKPIVPKGARKGSKRKVAGL